MFPSPVPSPLAACRMVPSRLHELHESKFPFVSRIEFIRSKLSNFSAHVYGVVSVLGCTDGRVGTAAGGPQAAAARCLPDKEAAPRRAAARLWPLIGTCYRPSAVSGTEEDGGTPDRQPGPNSGHPRLAEG